VENSPGQIMVLRNTWSAFRAQLKKFMRARRGNVAMIFALSLIPITIAAGAGLDLSRALMVRARLAEALDAAGLAVGATQNLTNDQITSLAQAYFKANYTADSAFGVPAAVTVTPGTQNVVLSTSVAMPTTLMRVVGVNTLTVGYSAKIVWGQTKLWVSLVLDNTGSMCEPDSQPCTSDTNPDIKINALKTATKQLLTTLQGAAANPGDVKVAIIPFSKTVNVGNTSSTVGASWLSWTDWESAPPSSTPDSSVGPGSSCPYTTSSNKRMSPYGYYCTSGPSNGASTVSTIPSSGTYSGYICPGVDSGSYNTGRSGHYWNGCYDSVPSSQTTTTTCTQTGYGSPSCTTQTTSGAYYGSTQPTSSKSCTGSGWNKVCTTTTVTVTGAPYTHTWHVNDHSTWSGCIEDRTQDYDISNTTPSGSTTGFPPENSQSCVPSVMMGALSYDWNALNTEVDNMTAGGNTNQPIGLAWGWQSQTDGDPFNPGTLPANTSQYIILLSDGLNTQDRWYSDQTSIDNRMSQLCTNAKAAGITIYTIYVDLNGTQGNSTVLQNCASDSSKYFDLTTSGGIITTLNNIAQQITQLRVSQ
jgi:Flp pilus assembly protein TadG